MYPLIILGAGASHDCIDRTQHLGGPFRDVDLIQYRPPLLTDLFNYSKFGELLKVHHGAADLAATLDGVDDFEAYLTAVQGKYALTNIKRYKQLISLRFYLCDLFSTITEKYYRQRNYFKKLIENIDDRGGDACVVNFNYDLLFESSLPSIRHSANIDSYIESKIKVIKIHGACNWYYELDSIQGETTNSIAYDLFLENAENFVKYANETRSDKSLWVRPALVKWEYTSKAEGQNLYYLPALAMPITSKPNFVCPNEHIEELIKQLKNVDRILIIGWKGNDEYLIKLLTKNIVKQTPVTIVSKTSSVKVVNKLKTNTFLSFTPLGFGFTEFIKNKGIEKFLDM